jgi:hypothetical protein
MVKLLIKQMGADVNHKVVIDMNLNENVECPAFAFSVTQHWDPDMLKHLVEEFGADINAEVKIGSQPVSLLHLAVCFVEE